MTNKEFFKVLAQRAKRFGFKKNKKGMIRENETGNCPVCAVAAEVKGRKEAFDKDDAFKARKFLKLNRHLVDVVVESSDSGGKFPFRPRKNGYETKVTNTLKKITKVS